MLSRLFVYLGCALIAGGALALAWYARLQIDMFRVQRAASQLIEEQNQRNTETSDPPSPPHALVIVPPRKGEPVGRLEIPRLHVSVAVLEGTTAKVLRVAAGHISGTALPGTAGNIGIAAHRDTFFRGLREVRPQDIISLTTSYGTFRYIVDAVKIVAPTDVRVLSRTTDSELTLVTCYPFTYIGSAPKRFIVHARQEHS